MCVCLCVSWMFFFIVVAFVDAAVAFSTLKYNCMSEWKRLSKHLSILHSLSLTLSSFGVFCGP